MKKRKKIKYIYDCLEYNILQSKLNLVLKNINEVNIQKRSWSEFSDGNKCIKEYMNNKIEMGKDINDNGLYLPFIASINKDFVVRDKAVVDTGSHRLEGIKIYNDKNPESIKNYIFVLYNKYEIKSGYCYYIVPKYYKVPKDIDMKDLYLKDNINPKYFIKDLMYGMCLVRYSLKSIQPINAIAECISDQIWDWNNSNKDNRIKSKKLFNNIFYFLEDKEEKINKLYNKLIKNI